MIENITEANLPGLYLTLDNNSPWVSDVVLKSLLEETPQITSNKILLYLFKNPDVLKSPSFIEYLEKSMILDQSELDMLKDSTLNRTSRTSAEEVISAYKLTLDNIATSYLASFSNDSVNISSEEYIHWLKNFGYYQMDELVVEELLDKNMHSEAILFIDSMIARNNLVGIEIAEHNLLKDLVNIIIEAYSEDRTLYNLDSIEIDQIKAINLSSSGLSAILTDNILLANGLIDFPYNGCVLPPPPPIGISNVEKYQYLKTPPREEKEKAVLYPNPASDFITIDISDFIGKYKNINCIVTDFIGNIKFSKNIDNKLPNIVLRTNDFAVGAYYYRLTQDNVLIDTGKFILVK